MMVSITGEKPMERNMPVMTVLYPSADGTNFDHDYYMASHASLVRRLWSPLGMQEFTVMRSIPGPDGAAPAFTLIAQLTFATMDAFKAAAAQHGEEIFADIPKFTNATPVLQFNEPA